MKDKNNLAPINVWSGGDYLNTREGYIRAGNNILTVSNEYSINGETSIKSTRIGDTGTYFDICHLTDLNEGDTITISASIYNPECICSCVVYSQNPATNITLMRLPKSDKVNKISISGQIPLFDHYVTMRCFVMELGCSVYIDDVDVRIS